MLDKKLEKAINDQINFEFYSAYLYLAMNSYFNANNFKGMANWMWVQAQEETTHAMKLYDYVDDRGGTVALQAIDKPPAKWKSPIDAFKNAYEHECKVTSNFNEMTELALKEKDHTTATFLQWFITEQIEEESSVKEIVDQMSMMKGAANALFMIDKELGQRVFTPPADAEAT